MYNNLNWQKIALNRITNDTKELAASYNEVFNATTSLELKQFLNEITPDLIAIQLKLQDKLRTLTSAKA